MNEDYYDENEQDYTFTSPSCSGIWNDVDDEDPIYNEDVEDDYDPSTGDEYGFPVDMDLEEEE